MKQLGQTTILRDTDFHARSGASHWLAHRSLNVAAGCIVVMHPALNAVFPRQAAAVSFIAILLSIGIALATSVWQAMRCAAAMRRRWALLSACFLMWFVATLTWASNQLHVQTASSSAGTHSFIYVLSGVLMLLVIVTPSEAEPGRLFFWIDVAQAIVVGILGYIALFSVLPFSGLPVTPIPQSRVYAVYVIEDFALAALATLRLPGCLANSPNWKFFRLLTAGLWIHAIGNTLHLYVVQARLRATPLDVLMDIPFLLVTIAGCPAHAACPAPEKAVRRHPFARLVDNVQPVLPGLALVTFSAVIAHRFFAVAMTMIVVSFVLYGLRYAMLQSRLQHAQHDLEDARDRLEELVLRDDLTGIANRRCFDQRLELEWSRAYRSQTPLALLLIDIDHFKEFNDNFGHGIGDDCLIEVAKALRDGVQRPGDLMARYGGEEFVALLPETDAQGAEDVAARLRSAVARDVLLESVEQQVTISIGFAVWDGIREFTTNDLIETADRALYRAKQNGRDCVEFIEMEPTLLESVSS